MIEFFASFLIWLMFAGLIVLWFIDGRIKKEQVLHALFSSFIGYLITAVIKVIFPTLRPFRVESLEPLTFTIPNDGSFPSGHSAEAFALATTIWLHDKKVGGVYMLSAIVVGAARVIANVHYPIDIVGGAFIGTLVAVFVEKIHLFRFLTSKKGR